MSIRSLNISPQAMLSAGGGRALPGSVVQTQIAPAASFWTRNKLRGRVLKSVVVIRCAPLYSAERYVVCWEGGYKRWGRYKLNKIGVGHWSSARSVLNWSIIVRFFFFLSPSNLVWHHKSPSYICFFWEMRVKVEVNHYLTQVNAASLQCFIREFVVGCSEWMCVGGWMSA